MLQNLVRGLCRNSGGVILVAGAIGVLAGVEHLMSKRAVARPRMSRPSLPRRPVAPTATDRFSIRRTRSELGYTYWVLQGHGKFTRFDLFDTWQEAVDEAQRRLSQSSSVPEAALAATVGA